MRRFAHWLILAAIILIWIGVSHCAEPGSDTAEIAYGSDDTVCSFSGSVGCQRLDFYKRTTGSATGPVIVVVHGGAFFGGCKNGSAANGCCTAGDGATCTGPNSGRTFATMADWFRDTTFSGTLTQNYSAVSLDYRLNDASGTKHYCKDQTDDIRTALNFMCSTWGTCTFILAGHSAGITNEIVAAWGPNPSCGGSVALSGSVTILGAMGTGLVGRHSLLNAVDGTAGATCLAGGTNPRCRFEQWSGFTQSANSADIAAANPYALLDGADKLYYGAWGATDAIADCTQDQCEISDFTTECTVAIQLNAAQSGVVVTPICEAGAGHNGPIECPSNWVPGTGNCATTAAMFTAALAVFDPPVVPPVGPVTRSVGAAISGATMK